MKSSLLATLSMALLTAPAFADTVIAVSCQCSFNLNSSKQTILVYGERTDATVFDVENCVLEDGKVAPGDLLVCERPSSDQLRKRSKKLFPRSVVYS